MNETGNSRPICSQASNSNRIILPKELPHIYPCVQQEAPHLKQRRQDDHADGQTTNNHNSESDLVRELPPKKPRWVDPDNAGSAWIGQGDRRYGFAPRKSRLKSKWSKSRPRRPKFKEPADYTDKNIPAISTQQRTLSSSAEIGQNNSYLSIFVKEDASGIISEQAAHCAEGEYPDSVDAFWEEMRKKYKKETAKHKFEIIDKIQKVVKEKPEIKAPANDGNETNNTESFKESRHYSESLSKSRAVLSSLLARLKSDRSSTLSYANRISDQLNQMPPKIKSDDSNDTFRPTHGRSGKFSSTSTEKRAVTNISDREMYPDPATIVSERKQRKRKERPKPPPAHTGSPPSGIYVVPHHMLPFENKKKKWGDNSEPIDLSIGSGEVPRTRDKPFEEVLDLSVKREKRETSALGIRAQQVPIASIKPMLPTKLHSDSNKIEVIPSVPLHPDVSSNENMTITENRNRVCQQRKGQFEAIESHVSSPVSTDEDIAEVTSLHVSVFMETPKKITRAEVTSNIPRKPLNLQVPARVKGNQQYAQVKYRAEDPNVKFSSRPFTDKSALPHGTQAKETTSGTASQCANCSTSLFNKDGRVQNEVEYSLYQIRRKRKKKCTEPTDWTPTAQIPCETITHNRSTHSNIVTHARNVFSFESGSQQDVKESFKKLTETDSPENYNDITRERMFEKVAGTKGGKLGRKTQYLKSRDIVIDSGVEANEMSSVNLDAERAPPTKGRIKEDIVPRRTGQLQHVQLEPQANTQVQNIRKARRIKKKKEVTKSMKRSGLTNTDAKQTNEVMQEQGEPVANMESCFDATAFLAQMQIEAYDIKMKGKVENQIHV